MQESILNNKDFVILMQRHCYELLQKLMATNTEFAIVCNTKFVEFDPPLPKDLDLSENAYTMFALAGYTFESIELDTQKMKFHAGFGANDFATYVSVDLGAITQIQVDRDIIFVNFSFYKRAKDETKLTQKSMDLFLKNPKNDSFKK